MIPLRDANPSRTTPYVNYAVIALNCLAFIYEVAQGDRVGALFEAYGVVPVAVRGGDDGGLGAPGAGGRYLPFLTSMFLHGGWMHLAGNMLYLWIFGDNIEDRLGHVLYALFYLAAGVVAAGAQVAANPASGIPMIGASGAIAGVLGAYAVVYPRARVLTLLLLGYIVRTVELPAVVVLAFWFVIQVFSGVAALAADASAGGTAWWAHVGGFAAGLAVGAALKVVSRPARPWGDA